MPSEIVALDSALHRPVAGTFHGYPYRRGTIGNQAIVLAVTGVGMTNAAMTTALFVDQFKPQALLFTGSGARLNPELRTGDIVIGSKTAHHNAGNWTDEGMIYRKVRGPIKGRMTPYQFSADPTLLRLAKSAARTFRQHAVTASGETYVPSVRVGKIASGDVFGLTAQKIADIREKLGSDLIEMEGAAAAQVCWQLGVPHLVVRSGSNLAQPNPGKAYRALGQIAAHQAARFTVHLLDSMKA